MAEYKFFAKVYDRMMDNIPYEEWEQYLLCLLYRYGVPPCSNITELGCGTGVMTRLLAADGFAMTGIDLSEEMLHVARKKRYSSFDEHITYINSDMRDFHVNEKQDAIVSVCDSMNYLLTNEDLYKTMVSVRKSLKENGVFIFDLKTEYFFKTVLDGRTYREDMGDFSYIWNNRYDAEKHIHEYRLLFTHEENKEPVREKEVHRQRVFTAADIKEAAIRAGFTHAAAYDAFTYDKPRKCSERIYIVMKKSEVTIMTEKGRRDFCIECRKETEYLLQKKDIVKNIRDKEYIFAITVAVCTKCGEEMSIPGLIDKNVQEIDEQYRAAEGLVLIDDIERLMKIYKIGKAPLSLALGFGEVTIPRYLEGQVPSKEYSDIIKAALSSPAYMKQKLMENREKLTDAAYRKAFAAAESIESLFSVSDKMLRVIAYIFEKLEEVTPLMLQKLLYFIQGVYSALYGRPIFEEDCRAWIHGPVYPEVYELFRDFKYNPIDDARFALLEGKEDALTDDEKRVIDLVVNTFGMYGGKVLEKITHNEDPWLEARKGYGDGIPSSELLSKERIMKYYILINQKYDIDTEDGLQTYIHDMLNKVS